MARGSANSNFVNPHFGLDNNENFIKELIKILNPDFTHSVHKSLIQAFLSLKNVFWLNKEPEFSARFLVIYYTMVIQFTVQNFGDLDARTPGTRWRALPFFWVNPF